VLDKYFAEGAYRFQMQFGRGTFAEFYGATAEAEEIKRERRYGLALAPEQYFVYMLEADPLVKETLEMAVEQGTLPAAGAQNLPWAGLHLAWNWEPDYLLLSRNRSTTRLVCACVCFPSSWSVEEKIGKPIEEIHEIVPALNSSIGRQIHTFLEKLKPGASWTRSNWGLSRSAERNQHPKRKLPRLDESVGINEVFFRVEEQSLIALPRTNGILFGIRIKVIPLRDFIGTPAADKLCLALETMPEAMAQYKGLATARKRVIHLLGQSN
jgi:hypothetical protein